MKGDYRTRRGAEEAGDYAIVGKSVNRIRSARQADGAPSYVQDMRLPGMVFAWSSTRYGARLLAFDEAALRALLGVVAVVSDGNFWPVCCQARGAGDCRARALASSAHWSDDAVRAPRHGSFAHRAAELRAETIVVGTAGQAEPVLGQVRGSAPNYSRAYLSHAAIGPSCALAWAEGRTHDGMVHTQGAFPLRGDLAKVLGMQTSRGRRRPCAGAAATGTMARTMSRWTQRLSRVLFRRAGQLQWMRDDEFAWRPSVPQWR